MAQPFNEFIDNKRMLFIAREWQKEADQLAVWAMDRLVNRRDVWGQYTLKDGEIAFFTLPVKERRGTGSDMITLNKLRRHFSGTAVSHLISVHPVSDHATCKWFAIDVDLHDENVANADELALANFSACLGWAKALRAQMLDPCLIDTNGVGGYHLLVLLDKEYPHKDVFDFVSKLREDAEKLGLQKKPEIFPTKPSLKPDHLGNPLRLPGRHHTRPHYSRIWNFDSFDTENEWLEGGDAIEALLELRPSPLPVLAGASLASAKAVKSKINLPNRTRICLDLDGVLAKKGEWRGLDQIGPPIPGALEFALELAKIADIIIFTSRCSGDNSQGETKLQTPGKHRVKVIDWLETNGFPYTDVYTGYGKPHASVFIDDRAVRCVPQRESGAFDEALVSVLRLLKRQIPVELAKKTGKNIEEKETSMNTFDINDDSTNVLGVTGERMQKVIRSIQEFYYHESGETYTPEIIETAMSRWLQMRMDWLSEGVEELFTTPHFPDSQLFRNILEELTIPVGATGEALETVSDTVHEAEPQGLETLYNGFRVYSPSKLKAMIAYLAENGKNIYKTKLNKLLFYADFVNFYLNGRSISGANYIHLPFGPVPDNYESVLRGMNKSGQIKVAQRPLNKGFVEEIQKAKGADQSLLSSAEIASLQWTLSEFGKMTTEEIVEFSHQEQAWKNTKPNQQIAYGYAQFFKNLPKRS